MIPRLVTCLSLFLLFTMSSTPTVVDVLSGRVYNGASGTEPPNATALAGVTVTLYGSNNASDLGSQIGSTTTNAEGWYGLSALTGYEYYTIIESDLSGFHSVGASSVSGSVINSNQIRYSTVMAPLSSQTLTGNKFWDQPEVTQNNPPVADADGPYSGLVNQSITLDGSGSYDPDPGDYIVYYDWDLDNDGQFNDATGVKPTYTWNAVGTYPINLRVTDFYGNAGFDQSSVLISEEMPTTGTIILIKRTDPPGANQIFSFEGDFSSTLSDGAISSSGDLPAGTYVIREVPTAGWRLSGIQIEDDNSTVDVPNSTATVHLEGGEIVTVTFYNTLVPTPFDYGDAPDPSYPTLKFSNGAKHRIHPDIYLGSKIDAEEDGQPTPDAQGDDGNNVDDDDGITFLSPFIPGGSANIDVTASTRGWLNFWIDFNRDGDWEEVNEHFYGYLDAGINHLQISVPFDASAGITFARFRFSLAENIGFDGEVDDGEVEDYQITINSGGGSGTIGDWVWNDTNRNGQQDAGEPGLSGVLVELLDANAVVIAATTTDGNGNYTYSGLPEGLYIIRFTPPLGYQLTVSDQGNDVTDSDALQPSGKTAHIQLLANEIKLTVDAGMTSVDEAEFDLGDAPDGSNHLGKTMGAYAGVLAHFPTVFDPATGLPQGPRHQYPKADCWLGKEVSTERDADLLPDQDGSPNLDPTAMLSDQDGSDDGIVQLFYIPPCRSTNFLYEVTIPQSSVGNTRYVNAWFDWNRDGDWGDALTWKTAGDVPEWAVQNAIIPGSLAPGTYHFFTPNFNVCHPSGKELHPIWMRVTIAESPVTGIADGRGPTDGYLYGETEDYLYYPLPDSDEYDFGDAPDSYGTLDNNQGAKHKIKANFYLGASVDAEPDGLPGNQADGDDSDSSIGVDDEDGVTLSPFIAPGQNVPLTIVASAPGYINAWIDYNRNNSWLDPGEQVFAGQAVSSGANAFTLNIPTTNIVNGLTYARFRFSSVQSLNFNLEAADGEVEDYAIEIKEAQDGSIVIIKEALPQDNTAFLICEELTSGFFNIYCTQLQDPLSNQLTIKNPADVKSVFEASIPGWMLQAITITGDLDMGSKVDLSNSMVDLDWDPGENIVITFKNVKESGLEKLDFGDAPDPSYPTLLASNGARHLIDDRFYLGSGVDAEFDGQPNVNATGDNQNLNSGGLPYPPGDEDGVQLPSFITAGQSLPIQVIASQAGYLNAWLDYNADGDWADAGEQILAGVAVVAGKNAFTIQVPSGLTSLQTFARFRLSSIPDLGYEGLAPDGEVEDYTIAILESGGQGKLTITKDATPADDTPFWITTVYKALGGASAFRDPSQRSVTVPNAPVGNWGIGEAVPAGWTLKEIVVTGDLDHGSVIDLQHGTVQVDLDDNEAITVVFRNVKGSEPERYDFGDAPYPYPTKRADGGAYHLIDTSFRFGSAIDGEPDGIPDANAQGDDLDNLDDESETYYKGGFLYFLNSSITIPAQAPIKLLMAVDWERDGSWANNFYDFTVVNSSASAVAVDLSNIQFNYSLTPGTYNARWRCYQDVNVVASPYGYGGVGEVEDCQFVVPEEEFVQYDFGDAPATYLNHTSGHPIDPDVHLGLLNDPEPGDQPDPNALGDDQAGQDDEDGVVFTSQLIAGQMVTLDVTASVDGYLNMYLNLDPDPTWDGPGERIFIEEPLNAGVNHLSFKLPADAVIGQSFARFRFSTQKLFFVLNQPGRFNAIDGEIEDYQLFIDPSGIIEGPPIKWPQIPLIDENPELPFTPYFIGWDELASYGDALPILADDWYCKSSAPVTEIHWWGSYQHWRDTLSLPPVTPNAFHVAIWSNVPREIDTTWSHPGKILWEQIVSRDALNEHRVGFEFFPDILDSPEIAYQYDLILPQDNWYYQQGDSSTYWLSIGAIYSEKPDTFWWGWQTRPHFFHGDAVRIYKPEMPVLGDVVDSVAIMASGRDLAFLLNTNEYVLDFDYGDAPTERYPTVFGHNGAIHIFSPKIYLGSRIDAEPEGRSDPFAQGDDVDNLDDEDGVQFNTALVPGQPVELDVIASNFGFLNMWADFNDNGNWDDPGEHVFKDTVLIPGVHTLAFMMPPDPSEAPVFMRFRFTSESQVPYYGLAWDGEVEDYLVPRQTVGVKDLDGLKEHIYLRQNFPNPFTSSTFIRFGMASDELVHLSIFNSLGQEIQVIVDGHYRAGDYIVHWDGLDKSGREVPAGMYLCQLRVGDRRIIRKMVRLQ